MTPASYTVLNFPVDDVEAAVDAWPSAGSSSSATRGSTQDEKGMRHGPGPTIAWFKDPAGNVLSVLQRLRG